MKANLPPSGTSSYQDPSFVNDIEFEETLEFGAPKDEPAEGLPSFTGQAALVPVKLSGAPTIDNSPVATSLADDRGSAAISASGNGEIELESAQPELGNLSTATSSGVGESTTTGTEQPTALRNPQQPPGSFIGDNWYYLLAAGMLVGWVLSKAFARRGPSFETAWEETAWQEPPEQDNKIIGDKPRGQFKKAERFMRPADKTPETEEPPENVTSLVVSEVEKRDLTESDILEDKSTKQQRVNAMPIDQPADDDFDFDLSGEGLDSDVFSLDEAAEINKAAHASKSGESSKRFKTEEDVDSLAGEFEIDDDEFDDQDSQLSLADSDTEFGFDLDDEEPDSLLGSGKQDSETLAENAESAGKDLGDLGLADVVDDTKDAVSGVAEGAQAGIADAATAAAGVAAAGAAAKGGFFSRLFGSKNKNKNADDAVDSPLDENEVAPVELSGVAADVPDLADDSFGLDAVVDANSIESLDGGDEGSDFDFDLEADDDDIDSVSAVAVEADVDEEMELGLDEIDSDDSSEFLFEESDEDDSVGDLAAVIDEPVIEALPAAEREAAQVEEFAVGFESDSDEFSFDLEDSDEEVSVSSMETLVDEPVNEASPAVEAKTVPVEDEVGGLEDNDSSDFGLGLFDDEVSDKESVEVVNESSDDDSSVTAPVAAATAAVGAGLATIGLAGAGSVDSAESDRQWEAKLNVVEDQNAKLSAQVTTLTKQLEEANKSDAQAESLQQKYDELTETVKSLGLEKDELLKEKEFADKETSRLTEELEAAEKQGSTWEQEKADLLKQQEELEAEKEAENSRLTEELEAAEKQSSTWEQEKADLLKQQEELNAEKEAETSRLTEELEAAEKQSSTWEQEKADLLKQQEELKTEKEAANSELESLTTQIDHSASELSALQAEVEALQTKLADAEAKPVENGSSEDIEDLRGRFKRRLAAEHRKRKQAEHLVEEAEGQRNEVAKLLRAAKAELKELKS